MGADNPGLFTLDGTRTYLIGRSRVAVVDPGPDLPEHVAAVAEAVSDADHVTLLLTHGHGDHAAAAEPLAARLAAGRPDRERPSILGPGLPTADPIGAEWALETDAGWLSRIETPGHTVDHVSYAWWRNAPWGSEIRALFCGDLLLGEGATTWVAGYAGCVADYLESLVRVESLKPERIFPTHGPMLSDPAAAVARFRQHRLERLEQVRAARSRRPGASAAELVPDIYGSAVPSSLASAAAASIEALLEHLDGV